MCIRDRMSRNSEQLKWIWKNSYAREEKNSFLLDGIRGSIEIDVYKRQEFGYRSDPFTGQTKGHTGIDIAVPTGCLLYTSRCV